MGDGRQLKRVPAGKFVWMCNRNKSHCTHVHPHNVAEMVAKGYSKAERNPKKTK